jgi:competence protein ComEC
VRRHAVIVAAGIVWLVIAVVMMIAGIQDPRSSNDFLTQLFSGPSSWLCPVRASFLEATKALPGPGGELIAGLTIGDTSRVSESLDAAMKTSSLTHLVAVSGANCQLVTAAVFGLLSWCGAPRWLRVGGAAIALLGFVALVTPGPSISRAAVMALAVLAAMAMGRLSAGLPVLGLSVIVLLGIRPTWALNYGFALSVLATLGLLTLTRPISRVLSRWLARWLATALAVPIAASLLCQPVLILLSPSLPTYGVVANLMAEPAAGVATIVGVLVCVVSVVWIPAAQVMSWIAWLPAEWIGRVATAFASFPFSRLPWISGPVGLLLCLLLSGAFVVLVFRRRRWFPLATAVIVVGIGASALSASAAAARAVSVVPGDWKIAACDVGQGDAVFLQSTDSVGASHVALIDTGRTPERMHDCVVRLGITHIDLLVLTHYDLDHVGGTQAVMGMVSRALVGSPENQADQQLINSLKAGGAVCERGLAGMSGRLGFASWSVIWPDGVTPEMQVGNPGSITMLWNWGDLTAAFLGDLGEAAQDAVLAHHLDLGAVDVLKVAHHGSRDTSQALTNVFHPRIALISVGVDNGYGHPTPTAIHELEEVGAVIGRTDRNGMLFVVRRAGALSLVSDR